MSRIRTIKPQISLDEELADLGFAARLFFRDFLCHCDREGRCEDRPKMLKAVIMPWDDIDVDVLISELSPKFIIRYEVEGKKYLQVRQFLKHQKPNIKEAPSIIPCCPKDILEKHEKESASTIKTVGNREGNREEGIGNGVGKGRENGIAPSPAGSEPPVLIFPTHGKIKEWWLTQKHIYSLKEDFPALDVLSQCRSARRWCYDNPKKQKTASGMSKFLGGWMTRQQNNGGFNGNWNQGHNQTHIVGGAAPVPGKYAGIVNKPG